jgi:deoxyribodipyrimidine photo-lyase
MARCSAVTPGPGAGHAGGAPAGPVRPAGGAAGGRETAIAALDRFLADGLARYGEERNHPDSGAASGLSPWLHWGHLSVHEVFRKVAERESWSPAWALDTLATHAGGERPWVYAHDDFEQARTHDPLWNAAQGELRETGVMHNYLRTLWVRRSSNGAPGPRRPCPP